MSKKVPTYLSDEAARRGLVPGAEVKWAWSSGSFSKGIVPNDPLSMSDGDLWCGAGTAQGCLYDADTDTWATVLSPAPSEEEGLKEGDAVECGPAMRAAIVELAKELGVHGGWDPGQFEYKPGIALNWNGKELHSGYHYDKKVMHTPEAFIAKMRVTAKALAAKPKPIVIEGRMVHFREGSISVGCTTVNNETVRAIVERLKD